MASEYFIRRGEELTGPFTAAALRSMALAGELVPDDLIGKGAGKPWTRAGSVRGLFLSDPPAPSGITNPTPRAPQAADVQPLPDEPATLEAGRTGPPAGAESTPAEVSRPALTRTSARPRFVQLVALPRSEELFALDEAGSLWRRDESIELPDRPHPSLWILEPVHRCMRSAEGDLLLLTDAGETIPVLARIRARMTPQPESPPAPRALDAAPAATAAVVPAPAPLEPTPAAPPPTSERVTQAPPAASGRGYVQSHLLRGESVVHAARLHWIIFISVKSLLTLGILPLIERMSSEFAVTNKRVIVKVGMISRRTLEMNLSKIETVNVNQSLLGRLLGYGTIVVIGTGGTREAFDRIAQPMVFRKSFQESSV